MDSLTVRGFGAAIPQYLGTASGPIFEASLMVFAQCGLFLLGRRLRRRTRDATEVDDFSAAPLIAFVAADLAFRLMALSTLLVGDAGSMPAFWESAFFVACSALATASFLVFGWLVVRRNFLRVTRSIDLGYVFAVTVLPGCFVLVDEEIMKLWKEHFTSHTSATLLGLTLVVLVFHPLRHRFEHFFERIRVPRLRAIEKQVEQALETIAECGDEAGRNRCIEGLMDGFKIKSYCFYSRSPDGAFRPRITRTNGNGHTSRPDLNPSGFVRQFLAKQSGFIDLEHVAFEWRYFFHQFALHRIEKATGYGYLLPITIGKSLRGMLLLPKGPAEENMCKDILARNVTNLGLASFQL